MDELESLKQQLEDLKKLREELSVQEEQEEENSLEESTNINETLRNELEKIDVQIRDLEEDVKKTAKEYEESYKKLQSIIDEYEQATESTKLLSEEEIKDLREKTESLKLEENERSNEIKSRLDTQKKIIRELKAKKTKIENNIKKAEALDLSIVEYQEITSAVRKTSIMNAILDKKGLTEIIEKKAKDRTKEEKAKLKEAKEEIIKEISEMKKEHDDYSVLDVIEALYSLETTYTQVKQPRVIGINKDDLAKIEENSESLPFKIVNSNTVNNNYKPEEAPKDMQDVVETENVKVDLNELKPAEERVTVFKDSNTNDFYARKYAVQRFKLKSADLDNEVRINGSLCYKISEEDVAKIKNNANNAFSPYIADLKEITLEKEEVKENNEIKDEDTKDELIPGTNIKRPRDRKTHETDEEYEAFLKSYYDRVFPQEEKQEVKETEEIKEENNKEERVTIFKDVNSNSFYVRKYAVQRFKLKSADTDNEVRINGSLCYKISIEDVEKLVNNKDNSFSPYIADIKEISLEDKKEEIKEEDIKEVFDESLENQEEISEEDIKEVFDESLEEQEEISEEDIKEVFDESLEEQEERLEPSNIQASEEFKEELKNGGVLYNIVHSGTNFIKRVVKKVKSVFTGTKEDELEAMMEEEVQEETTSKRR